MRCDQFLPALTTGGAIGRWRADRHAARCPRCALARDEICRIETELAAASALTAAERALWTSVAEGHPAPVVPPFWVWKSRLAAAAAIAAMLALLFWPRAGGPVVRPHPDVAPIVADHELDGLRAGLEQLNRELADLRRRADLLDARRDLDALAARYTPHRQSSGL
jgi:hypothetical protein